MGLAAPGKDGSFQKEAKVLFIKKKLLFLCLEFSLLMLFGHGFSGLSILGKCR